MIIPLKNSSTHQNGALLVHFVLNPPSPSDAVFQESSLEEHGAGNPVSVRHARCLEPAQETWPAVADLYPVTCPAMLSIFSLCAIAEAGEGTQQGVLRGTWLAAAALSPLECPSPHSDSGWPAQMLPSPGYQ